MARRLIDGYAYEKLGELVYALFIGLTPAREKLSENIHYIAQISPQDFKLTGHQKRWKVLQVQLLGKTRNVGLKRAPIERLTVHNKTLSNALTTIFEIYLECTNAP